MAAQPRLADAVIIATQDRMHRDAAEAFAAKGYHILLEKPMARDEESCRAHRRDRQGRQAPSSPSAT